MSTAYTVVNGLAALPMAILRKLRLVPKNAPAELVLLVLLGIVTASVWLASAMLDVRDAQRTEDVTAAIAQTEANHVVFLCLNGSVGIALVDTAQALDAAVEPFRLPDSVVELDERLTKAEVALACREAGITSG